MSNVLAAIGCAQLEQLDTFVEAKRRIAAHYLQALPGIPGITCNQEAPWARSIFWMFTILVDEAAFGMDSRALIRFLDQRKIQARPLWQPMHQSPAHCASQILGGDISTRLNRRGVSIPCSVGLSAEHQAIVIEALRDAQRGGKA
jgi:perosamine synthetase